jgi:predicted nucleotidyltransferase
MLGLTQRQLASRSGVPQPLISAVESGRRGATAPVRAALGKALAIRPSLALAASREALLDVVRRNHGLAAAVFGSAARGDDGPGSDLDLLVEFDAVADLVDLLAIEAEAADLLGVPVDVVSAGSSGGVAEQARAQAVPL